MWNARKSARRLAASVAVAAAVTVTGIASAGSASAMPRSSSACTGLASRAQNDLTQWVTYVTGGYYGAAAVWSGDLSHVLSLYSTYCND